MIISNHFFKQLSDETRIRLIVLMQNHGELCVCELTHALNLSQPKISRHLAHLRDAGIVTDRRAGLWVYYQLNSEQPSWVADVIKITVKQINSEATFKNDNQMLIDMPNRPSAACCA